MRRRPYLGNLRRDLRAFTAGAACGLAAGVVLGGVLLWQYGPALSTRMQSLADRVTGPGVDVVDGVVIERAEEPVATIGPESRARGTAAIGPDPSSPAELTDRDLEMPVEGVAPESLTRQFADLRGGARRHEAIDIPAPRHTPVKAVEGGRIARLFHSRAGGLTIYQFDPSERFCYYYAHLEGYAAGLREGDSVRKGQVIGYVGTSGNASPDTSHLHFAIFRLTEAKRWWEGVPIDPFDVLR